MGQVAVAGVAVAACAALCRCRRLRRVAAFYRRRPAPSFAQRCEFKARGVGEGRPGRAAGNTAASGGARGGAVTVEIVAVSPQ